MGLGARVVAALKVFVEPSFWTGRDVADSAILPRTSYNYGWDLRQGLYSGVVMAPIQWVMRNFTEAPAVVERRLDGRWEEAEDHALALLLDRPNNFYDGDSMFKALMISYLLDGNAYLLKRRNSLGAVLELGYVPHWQLEPVSEIGRYFIDYYQHRVGSGRQIDPRDVVHLRFGLDPDDVRRGWSPLKPLLREVFTDDEASNYTATLLRNMGVPGLIITPKDGKLKVDVDELKEVQNYVDGMFSGDRRGKAMALRSPTEIHQFGANAQQMDLAALRDVVEERVCAALGLPAAVVGFGAGLQSTKVGATMKEMRRLAWVQSLIPMQNSIGRQLSMQLLPDFQSQTRRYRVRFDSSGVAAFTEEESERSDRIGLQVTRGILRVDRAQALLGLEVDETQKVYLRPSNAVAIDENGQAPIQITAGDTTGNGVAGGPGELEDQALSNPRMSGANGR